MFMTIRLMVIVRPTTCRMVADARGRPFAGEFSGGLQEPSWLRRVSCSPLRVDVSRGSRAGLTGWYSGYENEPSKANIAKTASEARSPASESLNYQLRKII